MPEQNCSSQSGQDRPEINPAETMSRIIGRLISLFVHETNNHLATLRESSGLGDDIINAKNFSDKEKLKELEKLLSAMDDRIGHAVSLSRVFGELGRQMESQDFPMDVNRTIEGIMPFLLKIARQKNLRVLTSYGNKLPAAAGNFSCLQCLIVALFDNFCMALEPQATATITTDKTVSSVVIHLSADCTTAPDHERQPWPWKSVEAFATANGFEVSWEPQGGALTVTIKRNE
jgi:C4-dicarboxylate-specific signal transduction histidine kinase